MKFVLSVCLISIFLALSAYAGVNQKSEGYRMGMLTRYQESGYIFKSGEGELNMGNEGMPLIERWTEKDSNGKTEVHENYINPWRFSHKSFDNNYANYIGQYVWIAYERLHVTGLTVDTQCLASNISLVDQSMKMPKSCIIGKENDSKSRGIQIGRVVQLSRTGTLVKSYEATIQCGTSGNQYKFMTVVDNDELFDYLITALKTGRLLRIHYDTLGFTRLVDFIHNTKYRIFGAELSSASLDE